MPINSKISNSNEDGLLSKKRIVIEQFLMQKEIGIDKDILENNIKPVDDTIVDYLLAMIEEDENDDETIGEIACSFLDQSQTLPDSTQLTDSVLKMIEAIKDISKKCNQSKKIPNSNNPNTNMRHSKENAENHSQNTRLFLQEIMPTLPENCIDYCLHTLCHGNVAKATQYLLENSKEDIIWQENQYKIGCQEKDRREEIVCKVDDDTRNRILDRYADQVVETEAPKLKPKNTKKSSQNKEPNESKIRYYNGQIVSRNGEKYVKEKEKEEWDGGSRGRVKTKGKRGPGWT